MRLILATVLIAFLAGYLAGGRLAGVATLQIRWPALALVGVALQFVPASGAVGIWVLIASFVLLIVFTGVNVRMPGFPLIAVGLLLNFLVIVANQGMPVTKHALFASGQANTYRELRTDGGTKHHLANDGDVLPFLGDVIPIPRPVAQAVSVGDLFVYGGAAWFLVVGMRRSRSRGVPDIETRANVQASGAATKGGARPGEAGGGVPPLPPPPAGSWSPRLPVPP
jgi:uncharacterized membrane protein YjfL (UPF0719 family)